VSRVLYKWLGLLVSVLGGAVGGLVAGAIFRRVWRAVAHESPPPATDQRGWVYKLRRRRGSVTRSLSARHRSRWKL